MEAETDQPDEKVAIAVQPSGGPRFKRFFAVLLTFLLGPWFFGYFLIPTGWLILTQDELFLIFFAAVVFLFISALTVFDMARRDIAFVIGIVLLNTHFWLLVTVLRWTSESKIYWDQAIFASFFFELTCVYQLGRISYRRRSPKAHQVSEN